MKSVFILLTLLASTIAFAKRPVEMNAPVTHVFAPKGFDSNDNVEIMVSGYLPNVCYKIASATPKVIGQNIYIEVKMFDYQAERKVCAQMVVPYLMQVPVGILDRGEYKINIVNNTSSTIGLKSINISEAYAGAVDEHVYAAVDVIEDDEDSRIVKLKGTNPSDCFELDRIETVSNGKDTFSILPILKQVKTECVDKKTPFEYDYRVPYDLETEGVLLHVRSMNGKSVNLLYRNRML